MRWHRQVPQDAPSLLKNLHTADSVWQISPSTNIADGGNLQWSGEGDAKKGEGEETEKGEANHCELWERTPGGKARWDLVCRRELALLISTPGLN